jgi:hypothetical protein
MDINASIQEAMQKANAGNIQSAQTILASIVRQEPRNARAWYLLSQVIGDPNREIDCLKKVLEIEPNNQQAKVRLQKLQQVNTPIKPNPAVSNAYPASKNKMPSALWIFLILAIGGLGIFCLVVYLYAQNAPDATQCVRVSECFGADGGASSYLNGKATNTCSKPITRISLHGNVVNDIGYQTNVIIAQINDTLQIVLAPGETQDYVITIPNRNYGAFSGGVFGCTVDVQGAYFVK